MRALEKVLAAIGKGNYTAAGDGYSCRCPAHDDNSPSLTITPKPGKVLLHCHAGCKFEQIVSALGLQKSDTFDEKSAAIPPLKKQKKRHATCDDAIAAVGWSVEQNGRKVIGVVPYPYVDINGKPFGYSVRFNFADGKTYRQVHRDGDAWLASAGDNLWPIFKLNELPAEGVIYLHEGEKACLAGWKIGLPSTCCKGGSKAPQKTDWSTLVGREVVIMPDRDEPGEKFAAAMVGILQDHGCRVKVLRLNGRPEGGGDLADIVEGYDGAHAELQSLIITLANAATIVPPTPKAEPGLLLQKFSDIQEREIDWLWKNRIIIGGVTIVTGPVGNTKSLFTIDLATRVSLGSQHPDKSGTCPQGEVLILGHEDDQEAVQKPRLVAAGADCDKIYYVHGKVQNLAEDTADDAERLQLEHDIKLIKRALQQKPNIKLLIFDPLPEFIAGDHNSSKEVRDALQPLNKLAQEFNIAVIAICHQNKKQGLSAVQTIAGSVGFSQVARTVLAIINDPDDDDKTGTRKRVMVVAKSNNGGQNEAQAYRLKSIGNDRVRIEWIPEIFDVDAEELVSRSRQQDDGRRNTFKRDAATDDLQGIMANGALESKEIDHRMQECGHSGYAIRQARQALGLIKCTRERNTDPWKYDLPADQTGTFSIDDWQG